MHAHLVDDATRTRMLKTLNELDIRLDFHVVAKSKARMQLDRTYYSELASFIIAHHSAHIVIVDKKDTNKKRLQTINILGLQAAFASVSFEESHKVKQLQAVDFIAWAIGRFYEIDDSTFIDIIKNKLRGLN